MHFVATVTGCFRKKTMTCCQARLQSKLPAKSSDSCSPVFAQTLIGQDGSFQGSPADVFHHKMPLENRPTLYAPLGSIKAVFLGRFFEPSEFYLRATICTPINTSKNQIVNCCSAKAQVPNGLSSQIIAEFTENAPATLLDSWSLTSWRSGHAPCMGGCCFQ